MIHFSYLDKAEKEKWLPSLFQLLYDNMQFITPSKNTYEQELNHWLAEVSPALEKDPRKVIMCFVNDDLVGYIQYYTRSQLLMIEEIQIRKDYQRTFVFYRLCRHLMSQLSENIQYVEAYADKRNQNSQRIMQKLSMHFLPEPDDSCFVHMIGSAETIRKVFKKLKGSAN